MPNPPCVECVEEARALGRQQPERSASGATWSLGGLAPATHCARHARTHEGFAHRYRTPGTRPPERCPCGRSDRGHYYFHSNYTKGQGMLVAESTGMCMGCLVGYPISALQYVMARPAGVGPTLPCLAARAAIGQGADPDSLLESFRVRRPSGAPTRERATFRILGDELKRMVALGEEEALRASGLGSMAELQELVTLLGSRQFAIWVDTLEIRGAGAFDSSVPRRSSQILAGASGLPLQWSPEQQRALRGGRQYPDRAAEYEIAPRVPAMGVISYMERSRHHLTSHMITYDAGWQLSHQRLMQLQGGYCTTLVLCEDTSTAGVPYDEDIEALIRERAVRDFLPPLLVWWRERRTTRMQLHGTQTMQTGHRQAYEAALADIEQRLQAP